MEKANKNKFKIFFCSGPRSLSLIGTNEVYIWPTNHSWNDFMHKAHCEFQIRNEQKEIIMGQILVGILDVNKYFQIESFKGKGLGNFADKIFSTADTNVLSSTFGSFFSLIPTTQGYRNLVNKLGVKDARRFAESTFDMALAQEDNYKASWFFEAKKTDVFKLAFMRNSEPFYAFNNAGSILKGLENEEVGKISQELNLRFKLNGFQNEHEIKFNFSSTGVIPQRINILIGKNGLGKSEALRHIVLSLMQKKDFKSCFTDPTLPEDRPIISRIIALGTPGETANTFPSDNEKNPKINYKRLNLTRNVKGIASRGIGNTLLQLLRSEETIGQKGRWQIFINSLAACLPINELVVQVQLPNENTKVSIPIVQLRNGKEQNKLNVWAAIDEITEPKIMIGNDFFSLSSGQLSFFKTALLACVHIENGSLVLIDEPETHLHPNLISNFIDLLDTILEQTGSFAILATHSAYFVREVSRLQVHVFKENLPGEISIVNPRLRTFGSELGAISHFVFGDEIEGRLVDKIINHAKASNLSFHEIQKLFGEELSSSTLMHIRRSLGELTV